MSSALYDALADDYDAHFAVPHRAAYDLLAWEAVSAILPVQPGVVIDAGCGVGRWAERLLALGHQVVGVEQAPRMAAAARQRLGAAPGFSLIEGDLAEVDDAALTDQAADVVLAIGSVQYTDRPGLAIARLASWARPGGVLVVLVDSLVALVLELVAAGRSDEAEQRAATRRGRWVEGGQEAELHLFDCATLTEAFVAAGLVDVEVRGLLVGASAFGRAGLAHRLSEDGPAALAEERRFSAMPALADTGKQLLATGHRTAN